LFFPCVAKTLFFPRLVDKVEASASINWKEGIQFVKSYLTNFYKNWFFN
jgi:hypothetical protein